MSAKLVLGNKLVDPDEYADKKQNGDLTDFESAVLQGSQDGIDVSFTNGTVGSAAIAAVDEGPNPFREIGIGKPLCVEIQTIYTGDYPNGLFGGKKDLLLVSGVKSSITYDAASKALNMLVKKGREKEFLEFSGLDNGTKIVYYSPAVDSFNTLVSFELVADTFEQEIFELVSRLFSAAAGIPVFAPAASVLLAGSHIIQSAGNLGNTIFASKGYLKQTFEVKFNNAGAFDTVARQVLIYNNRDEAEFTDCEVKLTAENKFRLFRKDGTGMYDGDAPYLIISLDGATRPDLDSFSPKLASAAILQKFYGADDLGGEITSTIEDALQLYNDLAYQKKAEKAKQQLATLQQGTEEYKRQEALYKAYVGNIKTAVFKPTA